MNLAEPNDRSQTLIHPSTIQPTIFQSAALSPLAPNVFLCATTPEFAAQARTLAFHPELQELNESYRPAKRPRLGRPDRLSPWAVKILAALPAVQAQFLPRLLAKKWVLLNRNDTQAKSFLQDLFVQVIEIKGRISLGWSLADFIPSRPGFYRCELDRAYARIDAAPNVDTLCQLIESETENRSPFRVEATVNHVKAFALYDHYDIPLSQRPYVRPSIWGLHPASSLSEWRHYYAHARVGLAKNYPTFYQALFG
jgi:methylphosphotriester-DNA--protein-cysteine methyltransferase